MAEYHLRPYMPRGPSAIFASIPARAGLLGNPSDNYHGRCISALVRNWRAIARLYPHENRWDLSVSVDLDDEDGTLEFNSMQALAEVIESDGAEGELLGGSGMRRIALGCLVGFQRECVESGFCPATGGYRLEVSTDIPRQVGLAGSSAIETAITRALLTHHGLGTSLPPHAIADLVLGVETEVLSMGGGLQDRLPQAYNQMLYMDFRKDLMEGRGWGEYTQMDPSRLPPMWLAYGDVGLPSGEILEQANSRWEGREDEKAAIIEQLADVALLGKNAIETGDSAGFSSLIDRNFDLRTELYGEELLGKSFEMVNLARSMGSSAKQPGSGGAIIGVIPDDAFIERAGPAFEEHGWSIVALEV